MNLENILLQEVVQTDNICSLICFAVKEKIKHIGFVKIRVHLFRFGVATNIKSILPYKTKNYNENIINEFNTDGFVK